MTIAIRPLPERDLDAADRIFRLAFGTFLGLPDPLQFAGDADFLRTRWRANPSAVLGAYDGAQLVGSNVASRWGSFGFFGPLTVLPQLWDKAVGQALLSETMRLYEQWGTRSVGLFTFPHSTKHIHVYQKYGFWPQALTPVLALAPAPRQMPAHVASYAALAPTERGAALAACRALANEIDAGLDLSAEIESVERQRLGDTLLVREGHELAAFAVCHAGAGSEAGSGTVYVKFAAVRPGAAAAPHFEALLDACEAYAGERGMPTLLAGVNTARSEAYRALLRRGFRARMNGVAMLRPHAPGTLRAGCYVLDDWR
ncbi:MAG: GNAT family N-acetyltransferase [Planctomycetota bacterium]|nr:MAG: GNAT family N-acetyltransferase [Planctomycetota bacterium]